MSKYLPVLVVILLCFYAWFVLVSKNDLPLMSYDEAWYASIAHNIVTDNSWMAMSFNGKPYYDHPPVGFWMIAMAIQLFGESEPIVRLPSLLAALGSLSLLYLLARQRTNTLLALAPSLMLGSSLWYVYRARSADLDSMLLFFFIATVYTTSRLAMDTKKWVWIILTGISLAGLVMIKTLVGLGILPALAMILLTAKRDKIKTIVGFIMAGILAISLCFPWYSYSDRTYPGFFEYHFLTIGAREGANRDMNLAEFSETLLYFRSGVGKWYYPAIGSLFMSALLLGFRRFRNGPTAVDLVWFLGVGLPFLLSPKTEVWHLLPLYPPLFLLTIPTLTALCSVMCRRYAPHCIRAAVVAIFILAFTQVRLIVPLLHQSIEFDRKDIALQSRAVEKEVTMKAAFLPAFVYYSQKTDVGALWLKQKSYELMTSCLADSDCEQAFVIDQADYQLLMTDKLEMTIDASNSSYLIISSSNP